MSTEYPVCPVCRYQRRPAHILALAMRAVAIPVRDAHEKLNQPTARRDSQWALGRLDEAKAVAEAHEESCACAPEACAPPPIVGDGFSIAPAVPLAAYKADRNVLGALKHLAKGEVDEAPIEAAIARLAEFRGTEDDVRLAAEVLHAGGYGSHAKELRDMLPPV